MYLLFKFELKVPIDTVHLILTTLIQCQAAIVSIIVTLTLVSIQVSAGTLSSHMTKYFYKSSGVLIFIILFLVSIFIEFIAIIFISGSPSDLIFLFYHGDFYQIELNADKCEFFPLIFWLFPGIISLIYLPFYLHRTFQLLQFNSIMSDLADKIQNNSEDDILSNLNTIFDLFNLAIIHSNTDTLILSSRKIVTRLTDLKLMVKNPTIYRRYLQLIDNCLVTAVNYNQTPIFETLICHYRKIGAQIIINKIIIDPYPVIIEPIYRNALFSIKCGNSVVLNRTLSPLLHFSLLILEANWRDEKIDNSSSFLYLISKILSIIQDIGLCSSKEKMSASFYRIVIILYKIGEKSLKNNKFDTEIQGMKLISSIFSIIIALGESNSHNQAIMDVLKCLSARLAKKRGNVFISEIEWTIDFFSRMEDSIIRENNPHILHHFLDLWICIERHITYTPQLEKIKEHKNEIVKILNENFSIYLPAGWNSCIISYDLPEDLCLKEEEEISK
jgi:hypothetical protein